MFFFCEEPIAVIKAAVTADDVGDAQAAFATATVGQCVDAGALQRVEDCRAGSDPDCAAGPYPDREVQVVRLVGRIEDLEAKLLWNRHRRSW